MALPKVQIAKRERIAAESGEQIPTNEPRVLSMVPTSAPELPQVEVPTIEAHSTPEVAEVVPSVDWKVEHEQTLARYRTLQGQHKAFQDRVTNSEDRVSQLEAELKRLSEVQQMPIVEDTSDDLNEEEQQIYGQSASVIQKLARKEAKRLAKEVKAELVQEIRELKISQQQVSKDLATTTEGQFLSTVKAHVKNFDEVTASSKWPEYMENRVPYTQMTVFDALKIAHNNRDLDRVVEIFKGFKPANSGVSGMVSPSISGSAAPNSNSEHKAVLKLSDRRKANDEFRKGRLPKAQLDTIVAQFAQAEREGRVDYNS